MDRSARRRALHCAPSLHAPRPAEYTHGGDEPGGGVTTTMATIAQLSLGELRALQTALQQRVEGSPHLERAAQAVASVLYERFAATLPLVRVFATTHLRELPAPDREFVAHLADSRGVRDALREETLVLSLLGTRGARPEWNERRRSRGHLGFPFANAAFVDAVPMMASLMQEMGVRLEGADAAGPSMVHKAVGLAGLFHVAQAATTLDARGRRIIGAQDFVAAAGIQTVFAIGGVYFDGTFVTAMFFSTETIPRAQAQRFVPLINVLKAATTTIVGERRIFAPT